MVAGLVDYMSTLVSGGRTVTSDHECSDKPPPLPPKVHRSNSVDRALHGHQLAKPVCKPPKFSLLPLVSQAMIVRHT